MDSVLIALIVLRASSGPSKDPHTISSLLSSPSVSPPPHLPPPPPSHILCPPQSYACHLLRTFLSLSLVPLPEDSPCPPSWTLLLLPPFHLSPIPSRNQGITSSPVGGGCR